MKKLILSIAVFLLFFRPAAFGQNGGDALNTAVTNLKSLLTDHMAEKAYLHLDRPYASYVAGEIVYFKAYVFMGERHEPSTISSVLHVDLVDKDDALLRSVALQLTNGTGWGDFMLPDSLPKGTYRVRAYTEWMRNDKSPYYFDQFLSVSTTNSADRAPSNTTRGLKPDLQFFPEGGTIVAEVPGKVAFKALGSNGLSISVKGVVVDNDHKEVAKITTAHLGMGEFNLIPEIGKTYQAMVAFGDGSQVTVPLPAVQQKGVMLAVNTNDPSKISITIRANRPYYKENINKKFELLIYYGGALKHFSPVLDNSILGLDLPAAGFPTGIVKITLMSETGEPMDERLVFLQNNDLLKLNIAANKQAFNPRENVQLSLNAKDKDSNPVVGSFSVSVVDESKVLVDENAENTLPSYMLLSSELKGHIESPNFYFANQTSETRADLDVLMLTQGYRRFDWKDLETGGPAVATTIKAEKQTSISGVLKTKSGDPIPNCTVTLISQTNNAGAPQAQTTDVQGRFIFPDVYTGAETKYILKAQSSARKNMVLTLDKPGEGPAIEHRSIYGNYNAGADILASLQGSVMPGVITANSSTPLASGGEKKDNAPSRYNYRSSALGGPGHANQVVLGNDIKYASSLSEGLKGLLHGVQFSGAMPYLQTSMTVSVNGQNIEPMLVVIDGVQMGNSAIDVLDPAAVEAVEIFNGAGASIYGLQGGQGVMVITTKDRNDDDQAISREMSPGIFSIQPKGYYKAREFYAPKYDVRQNANLPDNRTTIFWKPDVITDTGGNASFNFFNADGKGTYRVEIQGIDAKGNIGMQVLRYKVQ